MYKDPNPNNKSVGHKEKEQRKFTLKLVFIVVIGLSLTAFILTFRKAKDEVREMGQGQSREHSGDDQQSTPEDTKERKVSDDSEGQTKSTLPRGGLVPSVRDRATGQSSLPTIYQMNRKLEFRGDYQKLSGQSYLEVENIKAFDVQEKERFSEEDIIGEKNDRLYVFVKKGENVEDAMGVTYNTRTKRLGLLTGTLKIRFKDSESFSERGQFIREPYYEKRTFVGIHLSLLEAASSASQTISLSDLLNEQSYWQSVEGVKSVEVEILEGEIQVK